MTAKWPDVALGEVLTHRKEFIRIDDLQTYKRCRVQLHAQGIVLRDSVEGAAIKTKSQQVCRTGEFLVAEIDAKVGGYGIVPSELDGAIVSSHYFLYVADPERLDPSFLGWYCRTPAFASQVEAQGSTNYAAIRPQDVLRYTLALPPLSEQRRIVEKIDGLAAKVRDAWQLRHQSTAEAEALARSGLSSVMSGLAINGTLGDVLSDKPRNGWSARCDNAEAGTAVLSLSAVTAFNYNALGFKRTSEPTDPNAHYWLRPGDLLITRSNSPLLVGHVAIYNGKPSPCIFPDLMMRIPLDAQLADTRFVWMWLQTSTVRDFIVLNAKGTSPSMKKITQGVVVSIPFPSHLSLVRQRELVARVDGFRDLSLLLRVPQDSAAIGLDALLPSILDRAFKGAL